MAFALSRARRSSAPGVVRTRPRRFRLLLAAAVTALAASQLSCEGGSGSLTEPTPTVAPTTITIAPTFSPVAGTPTAALSRARVVVRDAATGAILAQGESTLPAGSTTATPALTFTLPDGRSLTIQVSVELLSGSGASELVEWSARAEAWVEAGRTIPFALMFTRGPLANVGVTSLRITRPVAPLVEGDSLQLTVDVSGATGAARVFWASLDPGVATVSELGAVRAVLPGSARIVAVAGVQADTIALATVARPVTIALTPDSATLSSLGDEVSFTARVLDARGAAMPDVPVTWTVDDTSVATLVGEGRVRARANGRSTVTASTATLRRSAVVAVRQQVVTVTVSPAAINFRAFGETAQLTATPRDARGHALPAGAVGVTWQSSAPAIAPVSDAGLVSARALGTATVTATADGVAGTAAVAVRQFPATIELRGDLDTPLSAPGETRQLSAVVTDALGNVMDADVTWRTSDPTLATVNGQGLVTATGANGTVTITATADGGVSGSVALVLEQRAVSFTRAGGDAQTGAVGMPLPTPLAVRITDARGSGVAGALVAWAAAAGSVSPAASTTDATGVATTVWTLGGALGPQSVTATTAAIVGGATLTFGATATPGAPASIARRAGDSTTATVNTAVPVAPRVRVADAFGHPLPNVTVTFAVTSGGGSLTGATQTTDAAGLATVGSWTLGTAAGANTVTASVGALTTTFVATGTADAPAIIAPSAGDGQSAAVAAAVATPPAVRITDQYGNPVAGVSVTFAASGDGSVTGSPATTNASGVATVGRWTLATALGANTLTATAGALSTTFAATGTPGAPEMVRITSGPGSNVRSGEVLSTPTVVALADAYLNHIATPGVPITAAILAGNGTLSGTTTVLTDATGYATFSDLALTGIVGDTTLVRFTAPAVPIPSLLRLIIASPGAPARLVLTTQPSGATTAGAVLARQPVVRVADAAGNAIPGSGVAVTAAIASGGGVLGGTVTVNTAASGVATFTDLRLDGLAGNHTLRFSAAGVADAVSATVTVTAGAPARLAVLGQPAATASAGGALAPQPTVRVEDAFGNPVAQAGLAVAAAIASGGGTLGGTTTVTTDATGLATFTDLSIAGVVGNRTLDFSAAGLTGATSNAIAITAGAAAALTFAVQPASSVAGAPIAPGVQVAIVDAYGNVVPSAADQVTVALGTNPGGGTLSGTTSAAAVSGLATFADLSLNALGAGYTLTASAGALSSVTSTPFDVTHGPLDHFVVEAAGGGAIGTQTSGTSFNVRVTARDAFNNTVTGFTGTVGFTSTPTGGISAGATSGAFTAGVLASHAITFGAAGSYTLTATRTSGAERGTSATFDVQAPPAANADAPAPTSAPGDAYHARYSTSGSPQVFTLPAPGVLANDALGFPVASLTSFGGDSVGGTVTTYAAGSTVAPLPGHASGSLTVHADGSIAFTPPDGFTGHYVFGYRLTNARGTADAQVTIAVGERPVAANDAYPHTLVGNVPINTATSTNFRVTANDQGDAKTLAIVGQSNGTATLNADSTFTFRPTPGYEGAASFTYTVSNGFGTSAPATVSMTVAPPIWFVDASAAPGGDGRYDTPFNTLPALAAINDGAGNNPANGDRIFLYTGSYTGGLALRANQRLIGQGATASLSALAGVTWPADAGAEPTMSGTAPTITTAAAATNGVTLGSGNTLRGFNLGNITGAALAGTGFGTLTISEVGINTTGQALSLTTGTLAGSFPVLRSSGGTHNVHLQNVLTTGTSTLGSSADALSGATGDALRIDGGTGSFTYAGTITNAASLAVNIANKSGGTVTLSGDINPAAAARGIAIASNSGGTITFTGANQKISTGATTGVSLSNNTGATVSFSGGALAIATTTGNGFSATGGGTVTVTGANNTITSAGGVALDVTNTTIGAGGLVFRSIAATGGANGIVLNNTGATAGLTVTGDGATLGSGGTIRNTIGADLAVAGNGIYLANTRDVALNWMLLNDHQNHAIRGSNVANFTLHRARLTGVNGTNSAGGFNEGSISFDGLTGQASITNSYIGGGFTDNVRVVNGAGTLDRIVFTNDTIAHNSTSDGNDGVLLEASGAAVMRVTIQNSNFTGARGDLFQLNVLGTATSDLVFTGNTLTNNHPNIVSGGGGVTISSGGAGSAINLTYDIANNTFRDALGSALVLSKGSGAGSMTGVVQNNQIGVAGIANSGSQQGSAVAAMLVGGGTHTARIINNQIHQYNNHGILLQGGDNASGGQGTFNATVTGNTIANPGAFAANGLHLNAGTVASDQHQFCVDVSANALTGSGGASQADFRLRQRQQTQVRLPGYLGAANDDAAVTAFVQGKNGGSPSGSVVNSVAGGGGGFVGGGACM